MDEQLVEQMKGLFQEAYSVIYKDGAFDAMADQAEADGDVVPAVSQLVAKLIDSIIKDAGVTDINVLFGVAIMLIADLLSGLQEVGIMAEEDAMQGIINQTMQAVLGNNPAIAQAVAQDPTVKQAIEAAGGQGAPQGAPQPQPQAGVMGG